MPLESKAGHGFFMALVSKLPVFPLDRLLPEAGRSGASCAPGNLLVRLWDGGGGADSRLRLPSSLGEAPSTGQEGPFCLFGHLSLGN